MNVKELIEKLSEYPEDLMVVISGYEGGYKDIESISDINLILNANSAWYYGPHQEAKDFEIDESVPAIQLW